MIEVDSFILRNVVHFNEAKVPVRKNNGFVVISGLNKDSRIAEDQNNGAGKSLLWSAFPNAMYAAAPSSTLKNTKKDMLDSTKSEIEIRMVNNHGDKIKIVQKPTKWLIHEPDSKTGELVDSKARTTSIQQEKIAEHFPLTSDEFYAYTYLSSIQGQRLHFQVEKPAERLKFITSIFQLDSYDKLKKYFTGMLAKIKDEQTRFSVLESKLLNVNTQLEKIQWTEETIAQAKEAKAKFSDMKTERDELARTVSKGETRLGQLKSLMRLLEKKEAIHQHFPADRSVEEIEAKLRKRKAVIREYDAYLKELKAYEKRVARYKDALAELEAKELTPVKKINKKLPALQEKAEELIAEMEQTREVTRRKDKWSKIADTCLAELGELGYDSPESVDMESDLDDDLSICRTTLKLKKLLNSTKDSVCPTCLQSVDLKSVEKSVKKAQKRLEKLETLADARQLVSRLRDAKKELKGFTSVSSVDELREKLEETKKKSRHFDAELKSHIKIADLKSELAQIEEPTEPDKKPPKSASVEDIDESLSMCREIAKIEHSIEVLVEDSKFLRKSMVDPSSAFKTTERKLKKLKDQLKEIDSTYKSVSKLVSEYDLRLGEYRILSKQKLELESELEEIKPILAKRDLYKALEKAYSAKGLKVSKANDIVRLLEANLNRYANLIFAEPFEFKVFANEKGVFCEVDRGNGKISDVRLMSGSESDSFRLLFMLSLLLMVPSERRTNFVVLDEPDSHMDGRTRAIFAERYLPFLREVVPHVFLITPQDHHIYSECERWVVVKEGGVSTLNRKAL